MLHGGVDGNRWNWFCKHSVWISQTHFGETPNPPAVEKGEEKMFILGMTVGGMAGAALGITLMCCIVAGKQEDQQMEQMRRKNQKKYLEQKNIHFRDMEGRERFTLWDGENICLTAEDGTRNISICRFVDEHQVEVDGQIWNTAEFLWQMERRGIQVSPLEIV